MQNGKTLEKEVRTTVCTDCQKTEAGFTYISLLFSLVIILISIPIVTFSIKHVKILPYNESLSVQQFFFIVQSEAFGSRDMYTQNNRLYFVINDDETVELNYYLQQVRRQVNGRGHEVYLRNVESFQVEPLDYGVRLTIVTSKGERYERIIIDFSK